MALPTNALDTIRAVLEADGTSPERLANLRQALPGVSLTRCDAGDVETETPVVETDAFQVFLLDTSEHCAKITHDPAQASGLIVADKQ